MAAPSETKIDFRGVFYGDSVTNYIDCQTPKCFFYKGEGCLSLGTEINPLADIQSHRAPEPVLIYNCSAQAKNFKPTVKRINLSSGSCEIKPAQ